MEYLRFILLIVLLLYGVEATEHARLVIRAKQQAALPSGVDLSTNRATNLASLQPFSMLIQDGMPGRESDCVSTPSATDAEIEAIRDACEGEKTSVLKEGVLYTSHKPLPMRTAQK